MRCHCFLFSGHGEFETGLFSSTLLKIIFFTRGQDYWPEVNIIDVVKGQIVCRCKGSLRASQGCMFPCSLKKLECLLLFPKNKLRCSLKFTLVKFSCSRNSVACSLDTQKCSFVPGPQFLSYFSFWWSVVFISFNLACHDRKKHLFRLLECRITSGSSAEQNFCCFCKSEDITCLLNFILK